MREIFRRLAIMILVLTAFAGCADDDESSGGAAGAPQLSGHEREIYEQQKGVCKIEARENTIEYREQNGANDPERYAAYAAEHGFFEVRTEGERQAAIEGCLAGLP